MITDPRLFHVGMRPAAQLGATEDILQSSNTQVFALQQAIVGLGIPIKIDGIFGPCTAAVVREIGGISSAAKAITAATSSTFFREAVNLANKVKGTCRDTNAITRAKAFVAANGGGLGLPAVPNFLGKLSPEAKVVGAAVGVGLLVTGVIFYLTSRNSRMDGYEDITEPASDDPGYEEVEGEEVEYALEKREG